MGLWSELRVNPYLFKFLFPHQKFAPISRFCLTSSGRVSDPLANQLIEQLFKRRVSSHDCYNKGQVFSSFQSLKSRNSSFFCKNKDFGTLQIFHQTGNGFVFMQEAFFQDMLWLCNWFPKTEISSHNSVSAATTFPQFNSDFAHFSSFFSVFCSRDGKCIWEWNFVKISPHALLIFCIMASCARRYSLWKWNFSQVQKAMSNKCFWVNPKWWNTCLKQKWVCLLTGVSGLLIAEIFARRDRNEVKNSPVINSNKHWNEDQATFKSFRQSWKRFCHTRCLR